MRTVNAAPYPPLTRRQADIARLVAAGHSTPQIAGALGLAEQTIKTMLGDIYGRLGLNRADGNQRVRLAVWFWEQQQAEKSALDGARRGG